MANPATHSPSTGPVRPLSPIGYNGGPDLYAYLNRDPINPVDPSRLNPDAVCIEGNCSGREDIGTDIDEIIVLFDPPPDPGTGRLQKPSLVRPISDSLLG